jgi:hypothetical protein
VAGMTTPPLADVPIRTADELTRRWEQVLDPPVFGARSLWLMWLDADGLMIPVVIPVDDFPEVVDGEVGEGLRRLHVRVAQSHLPRGGHLALALCRPGRPQVTKDDEALAESLRQAFDGVPIAPYPSLHLAAGGTVVPVESPE